jgi:hypothetical protein
VTLHNGVIEARNRQDGGLVVSVVLPAGAGAETAEIDEVVNRPGIAAAVTSAREAKGVEA